MPYSDFMLRDGEELVLDLHPHWWYFASAFIAAVGAFIVGILVLSYVDIGAVRIAAGLLILGTLIWLAERYIRWISTHFVLTTDRVIYRSGVVAKHGIEIPLQRINTIFFSQRIFERVLGLGDLKIESASKDGAQRFDDIKNPSAVQNEIYQQMESNEIKQANRISGGINAAHAANAAPAAPRAPEGDIPEKIAALAALRDQGHITPAEFEAKKAELLGRM